MARVPAVRVAGPAAALQHGPLAEHRPGAQLDDLGPVDADHEHAVDDDVELVAGIALAGQYLAGLQPADGRAGRVAQEHLGQLPLQRRLDRGDEGRRVLVAPRRVDCRSPIRPSPSSP